MAIVKHECPLLEFSTEQKVYLSPETPEKTLPRLCLVTYFEEILTAFVEHYHAEQIEDYVTEMRSFPIYQAQVEGYILCATLGVLGAGGAAKQIDFLYGHGAEVVIACDSCGIVDPEIQSGTVILPVRAMRAEGASYHYLHAERYIDLEDKYVEKARNILKIRKIPYERCITWTTDGPYRESHEMVAYRRSEGCRVVETQCAAMAAVAKCRGKGFGEILYAGDKLREQDIYDEVFYNDHETGRQNTFLVALEVLCRSDERVLHTMEIKPEFFDAFLRGGKRIEMRCLDEKRRNIRVGDTVQLQKPNGEFLRGRVTELIAGDSFGDLYDRVSPEELGFPGMSRREFVSTMRSIYSVEREKLLGVIGIRIEPV